MKMNIINLFYSNAESSGRHKLTNSNDNVELDATNWDHQIDQDQTKTRLYPISRVWYTYIQYRDEVEFVC